MMKTQRPRPSTAPEPAPERRALSLLGLPIDVLTMDEAVQQVRDAVRLRRPLFLSTPNVNFLIGAQRDAGFRDSVLDSDLSLADGMPLVWMSRLLRTPLPERVTGAGLFERLCTEPPPGQVPIRVFFFGGPPGVAAAAGVALNARAGGLVCVGHASPGFGSVEEMSQSDLITRINASGADFVVVALGAAKGQAWIQHNRSRLDAPVISHLGAVVNFVAGAVCRAPEWIQRSGLEWLWRIKEEPALWRRYAKDARVLAGLMLGAVLPQWLLGLVPARRRWVSVSLMADGRALRLAIRGSIEGSVPEGVREAFTACRKASGAVTLDLRGLQAAGPEFQGLLQLFEKSLFEAGRRLVLLESRRLRRLMHCNRLTSGTVARQR